MTSPITRETSKPIDSTFPAVCSALESLASSMCRNGTAAQLQTIHEIIRAIAGLQTDTGEIPEQIATWLLEHGYDSEYAAGSCQPPSLIKLQNAILRGDWRVP